MLSKIKRVFFPTVFGVLYILFSAQLVFSIINIAARFDSASASFLPFDASVMLALEWLALIAARYMYKKPSTSQNNGHHGHRR
ncbi:MAG: hypothetical protein LBL21_04470 [Rickettsiales bacterium]|jgi:xanthine/uracil permease|nr:hypothetical protein [Rickettsiales bacterium]